MTFRIREAQTDALAKSNVGNHVARIFAHTAKASWYDEREGCVRVTGHRDQCTRIVLGDHGNTERLVSPLGRQTAYTYQGRRQVAARLPSGLQLTTAYDSLGRVMRSMRNDGESHELAYDVHGDLKSFAAADGAAVRFSRDSNRCLRRITERDGGEVGYDYDEFGRLSAVRDPLHRIAYLHYGSGDTPERYETPDGNVTEYVYDAASAKERVNATAHAEYSSDAEGRLVSGKYADGYDWSFQYDDAGRLATARTGDTEVKYEYDQDGRLLAEDQSGNVVRYRYNEDGQLAELQLPDGRSVGYDYDLDGRVESVRDWNGCTQQFRYGTADHPLSRELPNGLIESYSLDLAGRITGIEVHDRVQAFWSQRVERDAMGRVATQHDSRMGLRRFHYDAVGRLRQVIGTGGVPTETFEYDHASQRILGPHGPTSHDAMCRPLTNAGSSYSYDGLGNRLRQRGDGGEVLYSWTGPNLLSSVTLPNGSVVHYLYDAHGRRVRKVTPDEQVTYVWAGSQLVQEIHERGSERATIEYLYLPEDFRPLAKSEGGRVYYYHCDHLGTPQHLSDIAAQLVWSATYSAFGDTSPSVAVVGQPLRFLGQYWDAETGLHYNRARYYDPALGVYISRDPLAPIGENAYLYARGNPVTGTDPFGLFWESAPGWVKTTVAVAGGIAVGVAVGAAVVAAAPLLGVAAGVAGIAAVIAAGAAGGAAMGGLDAAMTEGGCVLCGMGRGAVIGAIAAIPFAFLPATAGALAFAGVGAASGAVGYFADLAIFGGEFSWGDLGIAMAAGTVFGVAGKYVGGAIAKALGRKGSAGAPGGKTPPEHAGKPTEGGARPDAETPRERARRKLEENQRQAREREAAADRERKQKNKEDGELKRKRGEEAEAISLEDARNHPDRDPNTSVHASEKEIQRDLGIPNDADGNQPKLPDNSITKTDGTQRFTETKNETQTNASEVREKFETVSQSDKYPDQEYVLEMWEGGEYSDPAYSTGPDGTLHHNGEQVTVGDRPIHVVQKPFPR